MKLCGYCASWYERASSCPKCGTTYPEATPRVTLPPGITKAQYLKDLKVEETS